MAKIIIEILSTTGQRRHFQIFDKEEIKIGRGYTNDIILTDPGVESTHVIIRMSAESRLELVDLNSQNGTFLSLDSKQKHILSKVNNSILLESGSVLVLGETRIRVFLPDHPIAPVKILKDDSVSLRSFSRWITFWYLLLALFVIFFVDVTASHPYQDSALSKVLEYILFSLLFISFWSGIWALWGRLVRHQTKYLTHLNIVIFFILIVSIFENIIQYLGFIFTSPLLEGILSGIEFSVAFGILIFWHQTIATMLSFRSRIKIAIAIPMAIIILASTGAWVTRNEFSSKPPYYSRLKPPLIRPFRIESISSCVQKSKTVFDSLNKETGY